MNARNIANNRRGSIGQRHPMRTGICQVQDAIRFSGIGRTSLYSLIGEGKVKSINLRKPGTARGRRLVHLPSLRAYLNSFAEGATA
jgi:hypothetical protein